MSSTRTFQQTQETKATAGKMPIWGASVSEVGQLFESAEAVLTKPNLKSEWDGGPLVSLLDYPPEAPTEHVRKDIRENYSQLIRLTSPRGPQRLFEILQQWEGVVSEITEDSVWADLVDLTDRTRAEEVVELPLAEICPADRPILRPGSVFYWAIGREWTRSGQMRRISEIRIRRTPQWSQHAVDLLNAKATDLLERFNGDVENTAATGQ